MLDILIVEDNKEIGMLLCDFCVRRIIQLALRTTVKKC